MKRKSQARRSVWRILATALLCLFAAVYLAPVLIAVLNSVKDKRSVLISALALPNRLYLDNYAVILSKANFLSVLLNSVMLTCFSTALVILVSSSAGFAIARWKSRWADAFLFLFIMSMFVPFQTIMITLLQTAKELGVTGKLWGQALIYGGLNSTVPIFLYRGYVKSSIPGELDEAALMDGCSKMNLFVRVVFPMLAPATATVAVMNALWVWNDFLLPYLVLTKPITVPLSQMYFYGQYNQQWHLIMAGFVISTLPIVVFYLCMQKYIVKGITAGAIKG